MGEMGHLAFSLAPFFEVIQPREERGERMNMSECSHDDYDCVNCRISAHTFLSLPPTFQSQETAQLKGQLLDERRERIFRVVRVNFSYGGHVIPKKMKLFLKKDFEFTSSRKILRNNKVLLLLWCFGCPPTPYLITVRIETRAAAKENRFLLRRDATAAISMLKKVLTEEGLEVQLGNKNATHPSARSFPSFLRSTKKTIMLDGKTLKKQGTG